MPDIWSRLRNRVRYGLATQEALDRIAKLGLVVRPYFVVEEPVRTRSGPAGTHGLVVRQLREEETPLIAHLPERRREEAKVRALLGFAHCIAAFENGTLLGYGWFRRDYLCGASSADQAIALPADCAYLFDMFVCRGARGRNVAAYLRGETLNILAAQGVKHAFSISLAFNRSTRRFKAKLGATEVELRLHLRLKPFAGLDLRLRRRPWRLSLPAVRVRRSDGSVHP